MHNIAQKIRMKVEPHIRWIVKWYVIFKIVKTAIILLLFLLFGEEMNLW